MNINPDYKIVLRKENSEKNLMVIENLNEAEAHKVFKNIKFPTLGAEFVKVKNRKIGY